jgi:uncharacterized surface protein with fasciclin (FAS1) repeats
MRLRPSRQVLVGTLAGLALLAAGCSSSGGDPAPGGEGDHPRPAGCRGRGGDPAPAAPAATQPPAAAAGMNFGPACSAVPASGAGSFMGMAQDPVATAASNNPVLSSLVGAVKEAGLVDTLNSADGITVFAPTDAAFSALPKATLDAAMADPKGLLTSVLAYHVVEGRLSPEMLAGTHKTLQGGTIEITGSGESFKVNGQSSVVCGNVQTANATVYIIDNVLMPKG